MKKNSKNKFLKINKLSNFLADFQKKMKKMKKMC